MKNKQGWILLIGSVICSFVVMIVLGTLGSSLNSTAGDYYSIIGALIGFIAPSIVYFGNKIHN